MSTPENRPPHLSPRLSSRVVHQSSPATEFTHPYSSRAPETTAQPAPFHAVPERLAKRTPAHRLPYIARSLSERDRDILASLDRFGFITTRQMQVLHFLDHNSHVAAARATQRALLKLAQLGVTEHLQRRVGGVRAGSASFVWRIGPIGDALLRLDHDRPRARRKEPSLRTLDHRLAAVDCVTSLTIAASTGGFALESVETEPGSWRPFLGPGGVRAVLKPDLAVVTTTTDYEDRWFLEVDRATESLPTLLSKCLQYERYRRTGQEQHEHGVFPWVVWVMSSTASAERLQRAISSDRNLDDAIFKIITTEQLVDLVTGVAS